ncbi:hypothetical protein EVG20_g6879 [Dentipellis fragilis]|uniref:CST complex subunit STN1 n=1 Tax=Dentipellis fragilis TaxID=205917 RepID=A0A4Y9YLS1_9AGAM|nr:hypothetical protein EVG20_g6879 [Dentipellis fragilis]
MRVSGTAGMKEVKSAAELPRLYNAWPQRRTSTRVNVYDRSVTDASPKSANALRPCSSSLASNFHLLYHSEFGIDDLYKRNTRYFSAIYTSHSTSEDLTTTTTAMPTTPQKRRRPPADDPLAHKRSRPASAPVAPNHAEIWKWTLSRAALAPCFVRDVFAMRESGTRGAEYYMLGRVPCRSVKLVGIVVGVSTFERRAIYWVDDGTGVVDCVLKHPDEPAPPPPAKRPRTDKQSSDQPHASTSKANLDQMEHEPPPPVAYVGSTVRVIGKVRAKHESREVFCDSIERCPPTDELAHWQHVLALHHDSYDTSAPFTIPTEPVQEHPPNTFVVPTTPISARRINPPSSGYATSPSVASSTTASSPAISTTGPSSPPRLRHPSRLHTRDLTANTFRIYLKHFMDNAPRLSTTTNSLDTDGNDSDADVLATPTKPRRSTSALGDATPRPTKVDPAATPRAARDSSKEPPLRGFTLSYLRRVPELGGLARRVVRAETRRRAKEEREREKGSTQKRTQTQDRSIFRSQRAQEGTAAKAKRLYVWAIRKLYEEGSIVLFEGPTYAIAAAAEVSVLWKSSRSADASSTSLFSVRSSATQMEDEEEEELSDPSPDEESYLPLTPAYLGPHVEVALKALAAHPPPHAHGYVQGKNPYARRSGPSRGDGGSRRRK